MFTGRVVDYNFNAFFVRARMKLSTSKIPLKNIQEHPENLQRNSVPAINGTSIGINKCFLVLGEPSRQKATNVCGRAFPTRMVARATRDQFLARLPSTPCTPELSLLIVLIYLFTSFFSFISWSWNLRQAYSMDVRKLKNKKVRPRKSASTMRINFV